MKAYAEAEPMIDHYQDEAQDNTMPGWLWFISMILMPAAMGMMTGMLENGWLPETFRIMVSNAQGTEGTEGTEETEEADNNVEKSE
jgi:hypothetical protein